MTGELRPATPLRRDEALAYIISHIIRHGFSPTYEEIGDGLGGISQARVKQLVAQLIKLGSVVRTAGKQRNLRVRDLSESRHHVTEALRRLRWPVSDAMGDLQQPYPQGQLPRVPSLRQRPEDLGDV